MSELKQCDKCGGDRIFSVNAKSVDLNDIQFKDTHADGYLPDSCVTDGDYVDFSMCFDCGKVQGKFPTKDPYYEVDEDEDDEEPNPQRTWAEIVKKHKEEKENE